MMNRCRQCTLPETYPGITFDAQGVCQLCRSYGHGESARRRRAILKERFAQLLAAERRPNGYDCLVAYSGGKDSSYLLALLKREYGARPLALTLDNGFLSPRAMVNMNRVTQSLGIDHLVIKAPVELMRQIYAQSIRRPLFAAKTAQRGSAICMACIGLVKFLSLRCAIERRIPFVAFGWSPGQIPLAGALIKIQPAMIRAMQRATFEPLYAIVGDALRPYFLEERHFRAVDRFPYLVGPLAFSPYGEDVIMPSIEPLGWERPTDTDANSSNCLLNSLANHVHKRQYHFHPYEFEIAELVREGVLDREEGLARLAAREDPQLIRRLEDQLRLSVD